MKHIIGYARVSTAQQSTDLQRRALTASGCTELFIDEAVSGSQNHDSAQFKAMMRRVKELRTRNATVLVRVTKLDRFSRSLPHLLDSVEHLGNLGASFEAADDSFVYDANSPTSVLMLSMLGALAQFERSLIKARMAEGRAYAKANGRIFGRRPTLTQAAVDAIRKERAEDGTTDRQLAKKWDVSRTLIQRVLNIAGYTKPYVTADEWDAARKATAKKG
ncbi:recombinase family protein [Curtobacterium herbarum]|uniref:Recombinase family protein n=1 Tax=Curtobacterium herbarum TaxID=150122 RepID=A0ABP4K8S1_9MICO|nr:recombinase family protein [Curtobacterium herbarum]MBM7474903.1 DNA invertase Pin-like site-specific DNA recombinase [Curtobacterium herbarum]MCS6545549.1 recombinase family protein [Curtobacterium herbarum]